MCRTLSISNLWFLIRLAFRTCLLTSDHNAALSQDVKRLKMTICGPTWMHMRHGPEHAYDHSVYKTDGGSNYPMWCVSSWLSTVHGR